MKVRLLLCILFPLLAACNGTRVQEKSGLSDKLSIEEALSQADSLKGEEVPIETVLFRYAYRIRVMGNRAVILDLHNTEYYYHLFTYPDFHYLSSFGKRGEGPGESLFASNVRFVSPDALWTLDDGKGRMYYYSGLTGTQAPKLEKDLLLDQRLFRSLDFDIDTPSSAIIPDYSGENRFSWASLTTGELLRKSDQIPVADTTQLAGNASGVAQGWRTFIALTPDKKRLTAVTQFGDRLDVYDLSNGTNTSFVGNDGEPEFKISSAGYAYPTGRQCYVDLQVTDKYIYTIYDGIEFKEIIKDPENYQQGGMQLRVFNLQGELVKICLFDRHVSGIYVDEARGLLFATDVNADEQLIRYRWKM